MKALERLQSWYKNHCDGDWEHSFGISIETLDNPGWLLTIDLLGTPLEGKELEISNENSKLDWFHISIKNNEYSAAGDPNKLGYLISYFLDEVIPNHASRDFEYEVLIPLHGAPVKVWTTGLAVLTNAIELEIISINQPDSKTMLCESFDNIESWIHDFEKLKLEHKIGDLVKTELVQTVLGVRLGVK